MSNEKEDEVGNIFGLGNDEESPKEKTSGDASVTAVADVSEPKVEPETELKKVPAKKKKKEAPDHYGNDNLYIWNTDIRERDILMRSAEDVVSMHGLKTGKQGRRMSTSYGLYSTSDKEEIEFLEKLPSFDTDIKDGFRKASKLQRRILTNLIESHVRPKDLVPRLRAAVKAAHLMKGMDFSDG